MSIRYREKFGGCKINAGGLAEGQGALLSEGEFESLLWRDNSPCDMPKCCVCSVVVVVVVVVAVAIGAGGQLDSVQSTGALPVEGVA